MSSFPIWDVVAAVGAASGIPALGWQIFTWRAAQPSIKVKTVNSFPIYGGHAGELHFTAKTINDGGAEATIVSWGFRFPDGSNIVAMQQLPWSEQLPATIGPKKSADFHMEADEIIATCKARGVRVRELRSWVRLATDKEILGNPIPYTD
ncbi:MAG: hypothetical protein WB116_11760 [Candidatus Dormiibacterota bacterium]